MCEVGGIARPGVPAKCVCCLAGPECSQVANTAEGILSNVCLVLNGYEQTAIGLGFSS